MDALRGYLQLASGLTEVTRERARHAAKAVVAQAAHLGERPGDARTQVRALADELATTARANRDLLVGLVRIETERAVAAIGVASTEDMNALRRRLDRVEGRVADLAGQSANRPAVPRRATTDQAVGEKTASTKTASKKAASKRAPSGPAAATGAAPTRRAARPGKKAAAPAKKAAANKAPR